MRPDRFLPWPARAAGAALGRALMLAALLALLPAAAQAPGDFRLALVIGNAAYPQPATLQNPVNDARAMGDALRKLGFTVLDLYDAPRARIREAIGQMREQLRGRRGVGLLYYAGHGIQHDWRNYLVPVDARLQRPEEVPERTVDVAEVLDAFRVAGNRLNVMVLDACRDNPFDNALATKGLAPLDAPPGTYVAFATAPGNVAADAAGDAANGLYTRYLLEELQQPSARLEDVFKRVKVRVRQQSGGRQVPAESTNVDEDFSFDRGFIAPERDPGVRLQRFEAEKAAWDRIRGSRDPADFFAFLQRYPNGFMSEIAQFRADQLQRPVLVAQLGRDGIQALASGANRYAAGDRYTLVITDRLTRTTRREPQLVTLATDERVEINGGATVLDQMGGVLRDDSGDKDPAMLLVPADIALGKQWRSVFQNRIAGFSLRAVADFRAVALEEVDLDGTRVQAWRVEVDARAAGASITGPLWIEPRTMRMVRWNRTARYGSAVLDASDIVVTDYRPVPR